MNKKKAKNKGFKNWEDHWASIGIMQGCIDFLLQNTREKTIVWKINDGDDFVGGLNSSITLKGTFPNGDCSIDYVIIEQTIVCTHFWNSIKLYDASGEIQISCLPDWEHGKDFWLLISLARQQLLYKQFKESCKKQLAETEIS